jgi:phage terminase large subunit GpA-like protein
MHYEAGGKLPRPVTAIARAQLLSVRALQPRYVILGTKGSYVKYGVDVQEDQLKVIATPSAIHEKDYGVEPEEIWGTLECLEVNDVTMTKSMYEVNSMLQAGFTSFLSSDGHLSLAAMPISSGTSLLQFVKVQSSPSSGRRRRLSLRW